MAFLTSTNACISIHHQYVTFNQARQPLATAASEKLQKATAGCRDAIEVSIIGASCCCCCCLQAIHSVETPKEGPWTPIRNSWKIGPTTACLSLPAGAPDRAVPYRLNPARAGRQTTQTKQNAVTKRGSNPDGSLHYPFRPNSAWPLFWRTKSSSTFCVSSTRTLMVATR